MELHDYNLATDFAEMDRLAVQHRMWSLMIGGLFPQSVAERVDSLLHNEGGDAHETTIVDVGCGSAIWAIEMAKGYPKAQVIGLDLVEQTYPDAPENFRFIRGDVIDVLEQFSGQADVIHCRCVAQHVKDPQSLVESLADSLKPGGLLLLADGDWVVYNESKELVLPVEYDTEKGDVITEEDLSWYAGWLALVGAVTRSTQYRPIHELVKGCAAFDPDFDYRLYYSPLNWPGIEIDHGEELGKILNVNQRAFLGASRETLRKGGIPEETVDEWAKHYEEDLDSKHYYNVWYYTVAQKSICV
ncbi:S-adenosyl-L-methionine-dependent methyltransferase [Marasmius fiardii PR-910]|nr:S-adenosyl-L-methionine-dependent methyltransferase [Marasmius fiardii PR-910]